ncbi:MAG: hypothetical protein KME13_06965 [Myxacorys californica WJT36-NPBG1]|jgi:hypothetical protein|nr:hypothetical protein [Myxacorys californica WJT36-NPBG1]
MPVELLQPVHLSLTSAAGNAAFNICTTHWFRALNGLTLELKLVQDLSHRAENDIRITYD